MLGLLRRRNLRTAPHVGYTSVGEPLPASKFMALTVRRPPRKLCQELHRLDALWSSFRSGNIVDAVRKTAGSSAVAANVDTLIAARPARIALSATPQFY